MPGGQWNAFPELYPNNQLNYVEYVDESMKPEQESISSRLNRFQELLNKHSRYGKSILPATRREIEQTPIRVVDQLLIREVNTPCTICQGDITVQDRVKYLPCKHIFHAECIDHWVQKGHSKCPDHWAYDNNWEYDN